MTVRTSSAEAREKSERHERGMTGAECEGVSRLGGKEADNLVTLSLKWERKEEAKADGDVVFGSVLGVERDSKVSMADHSFLG